MKIDIAFQTRRQASTILRKLSERAETLITPEAIPFLDPIDEICEQRPPRMMRVTLYVVLGCFAVSFLAMAVTKVDVVIVGTGRLATDSPSILLQPLDRGIIRELRVKPGDPVTKGEVLATLDPTFAAADLATLTNQQVALAAKRQRIEAELAGREFHADPGAGPDMQSQASLFQQRQAEFHARLRVFDEDIKTLQSKLRSLSDARGSLDSQLAIARDVETMRATLMKSQSGSKLQYLEAEETRLRLEREQQDLANDVPAAQHDIDSKIAARQAFIEEWTRSLSEDLVAVRDQSQRLTDDVSKASLVNDLVVVTAPQDGIVLDVAKRSVGSVVTSAEPLITIVPANAHLVGDITINSGDVGYTKAGEDVIVKVDAFPYQIHGALKGRLKFVSEESEMIGAPSPTGHNGANAVHRGQVELLSTQLEHLPPGAQLIPGMTLTAEIKVGARSVLSFFLSPLTRGLSESMREP